MLEAPHKGAGASGEERQGIRVHMVVSLCIQGSEFVASGENEREGWDGGQ